MEHGRERSRAGYQGVSGRNVQGWIVRTIPAIPQGTQRPVADGHCYLAGKFYQEGLELIISFQDTNVESAARGRKCLIRGTE